MGEKDWAVGIAELKVARFPDSLSAIGLGSCVGVTLYDPAAKNGGLAHIMLPSSALSTRGFIPGKFADTAIEALVGELRLLGSPPEALQAKLVGGANMFKALVSHSVPIGLRNATAAREKLKALSIPLVGEDLGGESGRTIQFSLGDGRIKIKQLNRPEFWL
ncbi:MAG TPA: chemotaxis protein CheD [bacterium]|nr:chemotaxis protein CheD [bacterium]